MELTGKEETELNIEWRREDWCQTEDEVLAFLNKLHSLKIPGENIKLSFTGNAMGSSTYIYYLYMKEVHS